MDNTCNRLREAVAALPRHQFGFTEYELIPVVYARDLDALLAQFPAQPAVSALAGDGLGDGFEIWAYDQGFPLARTATGEGYQDMRTVAAWDAWQAAWNRRAQPAIPGAEPVACMVEWTDEDDEALIRVTFEHRRGAENRQDEVGGDARVIPLYAAPPAAVFSQTVAGGAAGDVNDRMLAALNAALGIGGEFPARKDGDPAFWWRPWLEKMAGLKYDGERFVVAGQQKGNGNG